MRIKSLYLYLMYAIEQNKPTRYHYVSPDDKEYHVAFYKASEFVEPNTIVYIGRLGDIPSSIKRDCFYAVSDDKVLWSDGEKQSSDIKNFVERLIKLFPFM